MNKPVTKYHCPECDKAYKTKKEASKCARLVKDLFKPGQLVRRGWSVYEIRTIADDGFSLYRVNDYCTGIGRDKKHQLASGWFCKTKTCGDSMVPVQRDHLLMELKRRKDQYEALVRVLKKFDGVK